eukprot:TRINITY_DN10646_c0_g1_i1.p1 TRINITY_DN10646_c0_g1~~TRINITY_DN10646_c0_g1_i1.p1  ORF type:complete len:102 (+),score=9.24 TRINITY_DN10646_c0_g1_i1:129-434(+)
MASSAAAPVRPICGFVRTHRPTAAGCRSSSMSSNPTHALRGCSSSPIHAMSAQRLVHKCSSPCISPPRGGQDDSGSSGFNDSAELGHASPIKRCRIWTTKW